MNYDILVVDDSKAALFLFKKIVGLSGAPVNKILTAENGLEAIEVLEKEPVHLILSDINMPEMDGFQLIRHLKQEPRYKDIPIIVITTEGRDTYIEKAIALGAVDYIKKPFQPEQIKNLILKTLGVEENESNIDDFETGDF